MKEIGEFMDKLLQIDKQILNIDKVICRHISNLSNSTRGEIPQAILSQLRYFVEKAATTIPLALARPTKGAVLNRWKSYLKKY